MPNLTRQHDPRKKLLQKPLKMKKTRVPERNPDYKTLNRPNAAPGYAVGMIDAVHPPC